MPLISVIVPFYNVRQYLKECLDSLLNQTFRDIEIICINDGSSDDSGTILQEYASKDPRIVPLTQENKGPATARNIGLKVAKGKYISFVDGDDWINPETFASLILLLTNDIDAVIFGVNLLEKKNKLLLEYFRPRFYGKLNMCGDIILATPATVWNKIYRKDIIDKYEVSFPDGLLYEDNSFHWKYLMQTSSVYFHPAKLYNYRIQKDSIMSKTKGQHASEMDYLYVCREIFHYMKKYNLEQKYSQSFVEFFEFCLKIICASDNPRKPMELANDIWSQIDIPTNNSIVRAIKQENYDYIIKWINYSFFEKIFSLKRRHGKKVITILGNQFQL
ncbi:MAG: glycosyltransferase [Holosporaceae bacterium]|jgi:glycosyltransferase involved in cell wall biosynthesis|nr:glycosyltransferase [Holosporaceae bacterium]